MKPEWGQKRKCLKCESFFYDMHKKEFTCPKCSEHYTTQSYEEAKHKLLLKLAKKVAPKIDDEDLDEEALLQMTEDVPLTEDDIGPDGLDILEDSDDINSANSDLSDIMDTYDDDDKNDR